MGTVLARVPIGDGPGDFIVVEVDDGVVGDDQVVLASRSPGKAVVEISETLQGSFDRVVAAVSQLVLRLRSMPNSPEHAEIEFGLKLGGEAGLIFTRGTAEVNFQVRLSWNKPGT
jgi:Trypsin-co-occurring domain 1